MTGHVDPTAAVMNLPRRDARDKLLGCTRYTIDAVESADLHAVLLRAARPAARWGVRNAGGKNHVTLAHLALRTNQLHRPSHPKVLTDAYLGRRGRLSCAGQGTLVSHRDAAGNPPDPRRQPIATRPTVGSD